MLQTIYFKGWFGRHSGITRICLVFILFAAVAQFASFALIQAHVTSFYGAQPEDISFGLQIAYVGIITMLPVQFRLMRYFNTRNYLLAAFLAGMFLNIGYLVVDDLVVFAVLRLLTGTITCIIAGCMLMAIFSTLPEAKKMLVGVSLFFSLILTCGIIVGLGAAWVVARMNWTAVYYGLIGLQIIAMLLCALVFTPLTVQTRYPLYQVDWFGSILLMAGATAAAFIMIYGPKRYWFADPQISYASIFAVAAIFLFLLRQSGLKRPLIHLGVFRYGKFIFAVVLMLIFWTVKDSINLLYGYAFAVLGWSSQDIVNLGLFNVGGVIIATLLAVKMIALKKENVPVLLLLGFAVMCFYHVWVYAHIAPNLSFADLSIPIFIQGFACGLLFVPVSIFCIAAVPASTGMTGIVIATYARFAAALCSVAGFYLLQLYFNQQFKLGFLAKLVPGSEAVAERQELYRTLLTSRGYGGPEAVSVTNMLLAKSSAVQSQLLTIRAIFMICAGLMAIIFCLLLVFAIINKLKENRATT